MKKLIAIVLSAAMMLTCAANAFAAGRVNSIIENSTDAGIQILYNSGYLNFYDVEPKNVDGRVMIPFRAALEGMGASVDYADDTRLVTSTKGDTTISFTLLDDTIYIDNNGAKSQITIDVPMIIENDRTLVPIRFLSEAFGMKVGWDENTVLILDAEGLNAELDAAISNLERASDIERPDTNSSQAELSLGVTASDADSTAEVKFNSEFTAVEGEDTAGLTMNFDLDVTSDDENIKIDDAAADVILNGSVIYVKTDIFKKLAESLDIPELTLASAVISADEWYSIDLYELIDALDMPEELKNAYISLLQNPTAFAQPEVDNILSQYLSAGHELTLDDMIVIGAIVDMFEAIDKNVSVTETEDGTVVSFNLTTEDLLNIISGIVDPIVASEHADHVLIDDILTQIADVLTFTISATSTTSEDKETLKMNMSMSVASDGLNIKFDMDINATNEVVENVTVPTVPEKSSNIMEAFMKVFKSPVIFE